MKKQFYQVSVSSPRSYTTNKRQKQNSNSCLPDSQKKSRSNQQHLRNNWASALRQYYGYKKKPDNTVLVSRILWCYRGTDWWIITIQCIMHPQSQGLALLKEIKWGFLDGRGQPFISRGLRDSNWPFKQYHSSSVYSMGTYHEWQHGDQLRGSANKPGGRWQEQN